MFCVLHKGVSNGGSESHYSCHPKIQIYLANESMLERYNFSDHKRVRELRSRCESDQNGPADQDRNCCRKCTNNTANKSESRSQYKEPSAPKEIRQTADENLSN
jgi:hypothetical protein